MEYRCEAKSIVGFVQMLASNYLPHGYWFYVTGRVPAGKSASALDAKILSKYEVSQSRQQRARRKLQGRANLHYLRFEDFFVLLATHGTHHFFEAEAKSIRDIRKTPLKFRGYSLSVRKGGFLRKEEGEEQAMADHRFRVRVMIAKLEYLNLNAYLLDLATHRSSETLEKVLWSLPFQPYAPIRKQLLRLLKSVNKLRAAKGYDKLSTDCIRYRRDIVKPFGEVTELEEAA